MGWNAQWNQVRDSWHARVSRGFAHTFNNLRPIISSRFFFRRSYNFFKSNAHLLRNNYNIRLMGEEFPMLWSGTDTWNWGHFKKFLQNIVNCLTQSSQSTPLSVVNLLKIPSWEESLQNYVTVLLYCIIFQFKTVLILIRLHARGMQGCYTTLLPRWLGGQCYVRYFRGKNKILNSSPFNCHISNLDQYL